MNYTATPNQHETMFVRNKMKYTDTEVSDHLTAKEPEQRVAHMPPMLAPGPASKM